jgi:NAD(P)-dependent dehydrogenase (short-subunit alcohol dehydrogenase family)
VTGAGSGIGRAVALAFADPETLVAVAGRTPATLHDSAAMVRSRGGRATVVQMDVASEPSVESAFAELRREVGRLDVLVNNAGVGGGQPVSGSDPARWRRTIEVNLIGMYQVTRLALPMMSAGGRVINITSVLGRFGVPGYTAYCAAKHGVIGFTRALALELAPMGATANAVCPGWVETDMAAQGMRAGAAAGGATYEAFRTQALAAVPIKRIIEPEEVARLVVFLAAPESSAITGQTYNVCGGQTMD